MEKGNKIPVTAGRHCGGLALAGHQVPTKATSLSLPSSAGQGEKRKGSWVEIKTGKDHLQVTIMDKTNLTWGNQFNLLPIKSE